MSEVAPGVGPIAQFNKKENEGLMATSRLLRISYPLAALVIAAALAAHVAIAMRTGQINWPILLTMTGLLILTSTGAAVVPPGRLRN